MDITCSCGKRFRHKSVLTRHLQGKNNTCTLYLDDENTFAQKCSNPSNLQKQDCKCKYCNRILCNKSGRIRHERKCKGNSKESEGLETEVEIETEKKEEDISKAIQESKPVLNLLIEKNLEEKEHLKLENKSNMEEKLLAYQKIELFKRDLNVIAKALCKSENKTLPEIIEEYSLGNYFQENHKNVKSNNFSIPIPKIISKNISSKSDNKTLENKQTKELFIKSKIFYDLLNNENDNLEHLELPNTLEQQKQNTLETNNPLNLKPIITPGEITSKDLEIEITEPEHHHGPLSNNSNTSNTSISSISNILNKTTNNIAENIFNNNLNINSNNTLADNSTTNNNNNILNNFNEKDGVPFVYPFGYESINFLKNEEMLDILKSVRGSELVIDKIYSHLPNQNFINQNQKRFMITVIEPDEKRKQIIIKYYRQEEFARKLFENSIILLMRIYHRCHKRLSVEHKLIVLGNIKDIEEKLMGQTTLYDIYETIITGISNNSLTRRNFIELKKKLEDKDPEAVMKVQDALDIQCINLATYHRDISEKSLTDKDIDEIIWQPEEESPDMSLDHHRNNLLMHRVCETPRYMKRKELEKAEADLIRERGGKLGDVETLYNLRDNRNYHEAALLKGSYDLIPEHKDEINQLFAKKQSNMVKLQTVKFARDRERDRDKSREYLIKTF